MSSQNWNNSFPMRSNQYGRPDIGREPDGSATKSANFNHSQALLSRQASGTIPPDRLSSQPVFAREASGVFPSSLNIPRQTSGADSYRLRSRSDMGSDSFPQPSRNQPQRLMPTLTSADRRPQTMAPQHRSDSFPSPSDREQLQLGDQEDKFRYLNPQPDRLGGAGRDPFDNTPYPDRKLPNTSVDQQPYKPSNRPFSSSNFDDSLERFGGAFHDDNFQEPKAFTNISSGTFNQFAARPILKNQSDSAGFVPPMGVTEIDPYPSLNNSGLSGHGSAQQMSSGSIEHRTGVRKKKAAQKPPVKTPRPMDPPEGTEPNIRSITRPRTSRRFKNYQLQDRVADICSTARVVKNNRYKKGDDGLHVLICPSCRNFLKLPKLSVLMRCPTCSTVSPATSSSNQ